MFYVGREGTGFLFVYEWLSSKLESKTGERQHAIKYILLYQESLADRSIEFVDEQNSFNIGAKRIFIQRRQHHKG